MAENDLEEPDDEKNSSVMDISLLLKSFFVFIAGTITPLILELIFGQYSFFAVPWIVLGRAFHEIGHIFTMLLLSPIEKVASLTEFVGLLTYLSGFIGTCIAAPGLIWFSLFAQSRINLELLSENMQQQASIFMFLGYVNLYFVNVTLTHLPSVVGQGLDFTSASYLLGIGLPNLLFILWIIHWSVYAFVLVINFYFVFKPFLSRKYKKPFFFLTP